MAEADAVRGQEPLDVLAQHGASLAVISLAGDDADMRVPAVLEQAREGRPRFFGRVSVKVDYRGRGSEVFVHASHNATLSEYKKTTLARVVFCVAMDLEL